MYNNKYSDQLLPLITPEMLTRYPDQTCDILNKLIRLAQQSSGGTVVEGGTGNLEDIVQTTTSYDDGGVNVVTAYLSDGTTQDFQIRNGHKGSQGDDGESATIEVGNTTTLPAGSSATVVNTGTSSAAVLDFGIPKGDKGDTGNPGPAATVNVGSTTTLAPGSSATVTNSGTTSAAVLDFGIPEGEKGDAATIAVGNTSTLSPGSSATVTNSGTSSAAVFDFGIPKGDTGAAGADGYSPTATVTKSGDTATITITDQNGTTTASVTDGSDGAAATIAAGTTTTLSPGSSATVTNSGTSSAAVFDFGIPQGQPGTAATVAAGTTTTLPAGSSASVTNSGTSSAAVFDFSIPQGVDGADGADGADGFSPIATVTKSGDTATISITDENGTTTATVSDGAQGSPGPANTLSIGTVQSGATADATITGTSPSQTLNLTLPQGSPGSAATIAVGTTSTLPSGSSATVTNSGTSSAAVFDFGIPEGPQGPAGQDANVVNAYSTSTTDAYSASYANTKFMYSAEAGNNITIDGLASYLSGKQGMTGSVNLTQKSSGVGSSIPAGWYNYFWSPHRTGIGGDNDKYGTIILTPMTSNGSSWILRKSSSTTTITSVQKILTDTVSTSQIANNAVTSAKIDHSSVNVEEVIYTYTQSSNATGDVTLDIPINPQNYKVIRLEVSYTPASADGWWQAITILASNKNAIWTAQRGYEFNPNWGVVSRNHGELVAAGAATDFPTFYQADIFTPRSASSGRYTWRAVGCGGNWDAQMLMQSFQGTAAGTIAYIRVPLKKPYAGGWVRVVGIK